MTQSQKRARILSALDYYERTLRKRADGDRSEGTVKRVRAELAKAIDEAFATPIQVAPQDDARDAERYRWLRRQCWDRASLFVVSGGRESVRLGTYCPTAGRLDELVDTSINNDPK